MRAVVRWLTLLIGVAIVAAMAWYGARALFFDEDPTRVVRSDGSVVRVWPNSSAAPPCGRRDIGVT